MTEPAPDSLWTATSLPIHTARKWRLGPLHLVVARRPWEWAVSWWREGPPLADDSVLAEEVSPDDAIPPHAETQRFAFGETVDPLTLTPALGDRPFVVMPAQPFFVLPADSMRALVTVPLWVQVRVGADRRLALEIPVHRPHDTWFGSPTAGTLCYASRTAMQLKVDTAEMSHLRATIVVEIVNRSDTPLQVSRLQVPVPALPLLLDAAGRHVAPSVRFTRQRDDLALVDIVATDPSLTRVSAPRVSASPVGSLTRAFNAFFSRSF
jgi:hypothetical protein